jgi:hypothetical protein
MTAKPNQWTREFLVGFVTAAILFSFCFGSLGSSPVQAQGLWTEKPTQTEAAQKVLLDTLETSFTLDNVIVSVQAASLPSLDFTVSSPGSASQVATSVSLNPFQEFSVTAIPYDTVPPTEDLPVAEPGGRNTYTDALRTARLQQGGKVQDGPIASLFGQQITSLQTLIDLYIDGPVPKPVIINEWVVEAGNRLWIVRWSEQTSVTVLSTQTGNIPGGFVLSSSTLNNPSINNLQPMNNSVFELNQNSLAPDLPTPGWWQGDCDKTTYSKGSSGIASYRLGAVYRGVPACGPRPYYDHSPDVLVRFNGGWGEYEWECIEYSMRFLYLAYGIAPYSANGSQVVWNYSGSLLKKITNGIPGLAPGPDDVLSYGATSTFGHTSVVTASTVGVNGNGNITVIEENAAASGSATLTVTNWTVKGDAGTVSGWLTANPPPLTLSIIKAGTGSGSVASSPTGIDCGSTCSYVFPYNNQVILAATPSPTSIFTGWSGGNCSGTGTCSVTMSSAQSVTANFNLAPYHAYLPLLER